MNAQIVFKQLFDRHHRVKIPIIQRDFAQGRDTEKEVREEFLNTLHSALILPPGDSSLPLNLDFIYGSVEGESTKRFLPLDGQQRLTTLFLLHWYLSRIDESQTEFNETFCINAESRFVYSVRPSSTEFFNELVKYDMGSIIEPAVKISSLIKNQSWFYSYWRLDPTIQSCLTMLDSIHSKFGETKGLYSRLTDLSFPAITFQLLDLDNFGLSDDLYIKMNARGKPLTAFETFKARYEQELKVIFDGETRKIGANSFPVSEYFAISIDNKWSDFFWYHRDKESNLFDEAVMNLFRTVAMLTRDLESDSFISSFNLLRNKSNQPSFTVFHNEQWLDRDFSEMLFELLEVWSQTPGNLSARLPKTSYFDEEYFIKKILNDPTSFDFVEIVQLMGYLIFIRENSQDIDSASFQEWMRIVFNLSTNSSYVRPEDIQRSLVGLSKLAKEANNILRYFASTDKPVTGFNMQQISEERIKAELINSEENWKGLINKAEGHGYFKGQIEFLLVFCGATDSYEYSDEHKLKSEDHAMLQTKFDHYWKFANAMFNNRGVIDFGEYKWERALLSIGDYFIPSASNFSFGVNSSTDQASWKRLLRGSGHRIPEAREFLKDLWDKLSTHEWISSQLDKLIAEVGEIEPWRKALIRTPDAFKYCDKSAMRFTNEDVFLMKKSQMNGTHAELFSYCLFVNKVKPLRDQNQLMPLEHIYYGDVVGTDEYPHIKLSGKVDDHWVYFEVYCEDDNYYEIRIEYEYLTNLPELRELLETEIGFLDYESDYLYLGFNEDNCEDTLRLIAATIQ